jgi:hypothetical protein
MSASRLRRRTLHASVTFSEFDQPTAGAFQAVGQRIKKLRPTRTGLIWSNVTFCVGETTPFGFLPRRMPEIFFEFGTDFLKRKVSKWQNALSRTLVMMALIAAVF